MSICFKPGNGRVRRSQIDILDGKEDEGRGGEGGGGGGGGEILQYSNRNRRPAGGARGSQLDSDRQAFLDLKLLKIKKKACKMIRTVG